MKAALHGGNEFRRQLECPVRARGTVRNDQRRGRHRQLGRADRFGEVGAAVERVLDLVYQVLDRTLALVGVELGRDFALGLIQRLAGAGLDCVDLDHHPAEVRMHRPDDGALGGGKDHARGLVPRHSCIGLPGLVG